MGNKNNNKNINNDKRNIKLDNKNLNTAVSPSGKGDASVSNGSSKTITILSAYNRGQWLANELISKNYKVNYVDFTEKLGNLSPEAWESPFGVFLTSKITYSQNIWLTEGAHIQDIAQGFTILSEKGPLEFQGPMIKKSLERYQIDLDQVDYLKASTQMSDEAYAKFKSHFVRRPFSETWALQFAHNIASTAFYDNARSLTNTNRPLPLFDKWALRRYSRRGALDSLRMSHDKGVVVSSPKAFKSIQSSQKRIEHLKFEIENNDMDVQSQVYLNFLSQEEVNAVSPVLHQALFGESVLKSDWFWTKYRVVLSDNDITQILPQAFSLIHDRFLSWTHENFQVLLRTPKSDEYVVWVRLPSHYRFQHNKLVSVGDAIQKSLESKLMGIKLESVELPLECLATEFQVEVPHLPVFHSKYKNKINPVKFKNVFHLGPESWARLDTAYLLELQNFTLKNIMGTEDQQGIHRRRGRDSEIYS